MKYFNITGLALAATLGFAGLAQGAVIYNNGGPNAQNGNDATQWVQTEDFSFTDAVTVTGAGVYVAGIADPGSWDGTVDYWIFSDSSGPDSILASGAGQNVSTTNTGSFWNYGGYMYLLEFDFVSDFAAASGNTYWLGIHLSSDFDRNDIYWVTADGNATSKGIESQGGTFDNWYNNNQEHAFFLNGSREPGDGGPNEVPAPAGMALLGLGLMALGAVRRRTA